MIDIIGYIASITIVISIAFKTTSFKGTVAMRILNSLGSIFFVIYAVFMRVNPTTIANAAALIINFIYLFIEIKAYYKEKKHNENM